MTHESLLDEARSHLEIAVELSPKNARYQAALGEACLAAGDAEAASRHLRAAATLTTDPRTRWLAAFADVRLGRGADAWRELGELIDSVGSFPRAHYVRALAAHAAGMSASCREELQTAATLDPEMPLYGEELARLAAGETPVGLGPLGAPPLRTWFVRGSAALRRLGRKGGAS
jgi:tetratricopeptide (TPR) repeat protein